MNAGEIMTRPVLATTPGASVRDVAAELLSKRITGMPVADEDGTVLGIITEADIVGALIDGTPLETLQVRDVMTTDPITVESDATVGDVMQVLDEQGVVRVPITERGVLVGVVSRSDVIRAALKPEFLAFA